jgi:RNA-directed DNA polymerase
MTLTKKEGKGGMTNTPISLQDLRRSLYVKAKAESAWRFWGTIRSRL